MVEAGHMVEAGQVHLHHKVKHHLKETVIGMSPSCNAYIQGLGHIRPDQIDLLFHGFGGSIIHE
jgi:hypothetical protein